MSFLGLEGRAFAVFGVANKKSVGYHVGRVLLEEGARVIWVAHTEARRESLRALLGDASILVCDVERKEDIARVAGQLGELGELGGFLHSIAFARYAPGARSFHEVSREDFLAAMEVSCWSLVELSNALRPCLARDASVVAVSISTTRMAAENYGYMAPVKAALDSSVVFLAKSFSSSSRIRFNAVGPSLLKTASSAGIPGYAESYLYAERATLRKEAVKTREVADVAAFLLSPRSSGINAQHVVVDAGMGVNYFDQAIVKGALKSP